MKEFIETIAKQLVDDPSTVVVTEEEVEGRIVFKIKVDKREVGKLIGKQGRTAQSLRTILSAIAAKSGKRVRLEILD